MLDVVVLSLAEEDATACAGCGGTDPDGGHGHTGARCGQPRAAVRACEAELRAAGADVTLVTATSDGAIDAVLAGMDGPPRPDGLAWPMRPDRAGPRLIAAVASDGQLRAVLRRMVRRYAPPPTRRPDDLRADRTVPDLPPVGILPLAPVSGTDLAVPLRLPTRPADVAAAVLGGRVRRLDLLRTDAGSVTLHGALIGGATADGAPVAWHGTVRVDGKTLCHPGEPVIACAVANAGGYASVDGLALTRDADPADGSIDVAVLLPATRRVRLRRRAALEVRRTRGRAVAVTPRDGVPYLDDGVAATLPRTRTWWIERGAWAVYTP